GRRLGRMCGVGAQGVETGVLRHVELPRLIAPGAPRARFARPRAKPAYTIATAAPVWVAAHQARNAGMDRERDMWPELPYEAWRETAATLHLWMQIVGKVRLYLAPWVNHSWQVPLYVSARGLTTSPMPIGGGILELEFDFL